MSFVFSLYSAALLHGNEFQESSTSCYDPPTSSYQLPQNSINYEYPQLYQDTSNCESYHPQYYSSANNFCHPLQSSSNSQFYHLPHHNFSNCEFVNEGSSCTLMQQLTPAEGGTINNSSSNSAPLY